MQYQYTLDQRLAALRDGVVLPHLPEEEDNRSLEDMRRDMFINDHHRNDRVLTYPLQKPVIFPSIINTSSNEQIIHDNKVYNGAQTMLNGSIVNRLYYLSGAENNLSYSQKEGEELLSQEIRKNNRQQNAALNDMLQI